MISFVEISPKIQIFLVKPKPEEFHEFKSTTYKSANIIEGDRLKLECKVKTNYERDASVKWLKFPEFDKDNITEVIENDHVKLIRSENGSVILLIDSVRPSDRAYYVCKTDNIVTVANNTILVRVKGIIT